MTPIRDGHRHRLDLVVGHIEDGRAKFDLDAFQLEPQLGAQFGVERRQRLVHQIDGGIAHQRPPDGDALHLTARQARRAVVELGGDVEKLRDRLDALADHRPRAPGGRRTQRKGEIVVDAEMRIERVLLEDEGDVARRRRLRASRRGRRSESRPRRAAAGRRSAAASSSCRRRSDPAARRTRRY